MSQHLSIFQSLWAMARRHTDGSERSLVDSVRMIAEAGFDGINQSNILAAPPTDQFPVEINSCHQRGMPQVDTDVKAPIHP